MKIIEEHLAQSKIPVVVEGIRAKWQPRTDDLAKCREFGRAIGQTIKQSA